ncbi:MAG: signal peptidase II [Bacillota bacterium]|nr:signal peptidase II [Bacillota bacterium]
MLWVIIILFAIALDRVVKIWAVSSLAPIGEIPVIKGVFHLYYAENTGAAFSILRGQQKLFIVVTIVGLAVLVWIMFKRKDWHPLLMWAFSCIIGGGIGNLIDRIRLGYVVDYFYIKLINFPVFNIADLFVSAGAVLLFIYLLFIHKEEKSDE